MGEGRCCPENRQLGLLDCSVLLSEIIQAPPPVSQEALQNRATGHQSSEGWSGHVFGDSKQGLAPSWKIRLDPTKCAWGSQESEGGSEVASLLQSDNFFLNKSGLVTEKPPGPFGSICFCFLLD